MRTHVRRNTPRIEFRPMFRATELKGVGRRSSHLQVLLAFQQVAECTAERFVEAGNGWLLLGSIPGRPKTGGIYLYDDRSKIIFWLSIGGRDEDFGAADFDRMLLAPVVRPRHTPAATSAVAKPVFVSHRRSNRRRNGNCNRPSQNGQNSVGPANVQSCII